MPYPTQRRHLLAIMLLYEILSAVVDPVFGPDLPFALRLALIGQYPVANELVDLPYLGFDLMVDLFLVLPLVVPALLLVHLHPLAVLVVLVVGLVPVPLWLLVWVQAVEPPALLLLLANWEVLALQADLHLVVLVDELPGELHWLLGHQQYAT